jgi:hypothetical protein
MSKTTKKKVRKSTATITSKAKKKNTIPDSEARELNRVGSLTNDQLDDLCDYLVKHIKNKPCNHSHRLTRQWMKVRKIPRPNEVLEDIKKAGGYCDCEVLLNVCDKFWEYV